MKEVRSRRLLLSYMSLCLLPVTLAGCKSNEKDYDASGTFEAVETIVPAQANGIIRAFHVEEGQAIDSGRAVGYIDSVQLYLKKEQLLAQINAVLGKKPDVSRQIAALQVQLKHAQHERRRLVNLVKADAATRKQLDDADAHIAVIGKQIAAQRSALHITSYSLTKETMPLAVQVRALNDQLAKCRITNPVSGTVLTKYAEANEMAAVGKPLYKIADLSALILRAYITGNQFAQVKLHQKVTILTDDGQGGYKEYPGIVTWISDQAEFTPKTIQTKDERANLVYAIKISVKNDGTLKIGMYGQVRL